MNGMNAPILLPPPPRPFDLAKIASEYNIEAYGANPAAPANINTAAIVRAIAVANANGGAVRLPAKQYAINNITLAYDNVTIRGGGMPFPNDARTAFQPGGTILKGGALLLNYHDNIRVSDIGFDSTVAGTYAIASGDSATGQQNIRVENVCALGRQFATSHAFYFTAGNNVVITDCRAYRFDHHCAIRASHAQINNFYAEDAGQSSLVLKGIHEYDSYYCVVNNYTVVGNSIAAAPITIEGHDGRVSGRHVLSNINMTNVTRGILVKSADNSVGAGYGSVSDVVISNAIVNGANYEAVLIQYRNIANVVISNMITRDLGRAYGGQAAFSNLTDSVTVRLINCWTDSTLYTLGYFQRAEVNGIDNVSNVAMLDAQDRLYAVTRAIKGGYTTVYRQSDTFTPDLSAGALNGVASVPGPGGKVVDDPGNKASQVSGALVWTSGTADYKPGFIFDRPILRVPGMVLRVTLTLSAGRVNLGWATTTLTANFASIRRNIIDYNPGNVKVAATGTGSQNTVTTLGLATVTFHIILRRVGAIYLAKSGATFTYNEILKIDDTGTDPILYPTIFNIGTGANVSWADVSVLDEHWLPTPLVSDGFSAWGTSDGKGHLAGIEGGIGSGGSGVAWTTQVGTIAAVSGRAMATALTGGVAVATVALSTNRVVARGALHAVGDSLIVRWTDASNYLRLYHNGTNLLLDQVLAGVPTNLRTQAVTFVADAIAEISFTSVTAANLYYAGDYMGATSSVNAALTAANAGIMFVNLTGEIDNFTAYARGAANEYAALDAL